MMKTDKAGVYIHVPFCQRKCPYCDFYSVAASEEKKSLYVKAVINAIELFEGDFTADTLYFGGGTPSLLGAKHLCGIFEAAARRFGGSFSEVTLEANPCDITLDDMYALQKAGFNRISFGVQSLNDQTLKALGRGHTAKEALTALGQASKAGFSHISADLMLSVPSQPLEQIDETVRRLSQSPLDHISAYILKIEPNTLFFRRGIEVGEESADFYLAAVQACERYGFMQYEISSFAKSESARGRHNLKYWRCEEYLGIGPAAHSFIGGRRFFTPRDLNAFIAAENPWQLAVSDGEGGSEEERLMLGLRLTDGILPTDFSPALQKNIENKLPGLQRAGLIKRNGGRLLLTPTGFLVSNAIISELI